MECLGGARRWRAGGSGANRQLYVVLQTVCAWEVVRNGTAVFNSIAPRPRCPFQKVHPRPMLQVMPPQPPTAGTSSFAAPEGITGAGTLSPAARRSAEEETARTMSRKGLREAGAPENRGRTTIYTIRRASPALIQEIKVIVAARETDSVGGMADVQSVRATVGWISITMWPPAGYSPYLPVRLKRSARRGE